MANANRPLGARPRPAPPAAAASRGDGGTQSVDLWQPPDQEAVQRREGIRPRFFLHPNGTGLDVSAAKFEVLHGCGEWTWAHGRYCMMCGEALDLGEAHQAVLAVNRHPAHGDAPRRPFRAPPAEAAAGGPATPADARPVAGPPAPGRAPDPGSFNEPGWELRGPSATAPVVSRFPGRGPVVA
jgi:hypothetical protein